MSLWVFLCIIFFCGAFQERNKLRADSHYCFQNGLSPGDGQNKDHGNCNARQKKIAQTNAYGAPNACTPIAVQHVAKIRFWNAFLVNMPFIINYSFCFIKGFLMNSVIVSNTIKCVSL